MYRKNTASQFLHFQGVDASTGGIKSGVTWTVRRCIDGTFAAGGGTVTEDSTNGWYKYAMSQADTNGNNIAFNFTGTGAVPQTVNIVTTACDPTSTAFGLSLAKTTNLTGFNDISVSNIWQDTTAGDFTTALSIGKSIMNGVSLGTGLTVNALTTNNDKTGYSLSVTPPTSAQIATAVWQDTTSGDFTVASSIGKCLYIANIAPGSANGLATVGASLTIGTNNDKTGYSLSVTPPTAAAIATAVWTDTTAGDFTTALSIGKSIMNGVTLGTGLTINGYTGNTVQTGDSFARIGLAGVGLTNLGDTRIANLDATISSRGTSTLTQTQVTGGAYALNNASFAFNSGLDFTTTQKAATLARVTLTDTATTLTNAPSDSSGVTTLLTRVGGTINVTNLNTLSGHDPGATIGTSTLAAGAAMTLTSAYDFAKGTVAMTESYNADGSAPTPAQAMFVTMQMLTEMSISNTTMTIKKLDGSTTAMTLTLDSSTSPTSITRAT